MITKLTPIEIWACIVAVVAILLVLIFAPYLNNMDPFYRIILFILFISGIILIGVSNG
jgi:ABC-type thiamin/hydroxymethylpyrimidine transport system permease subunit